MKKLAEELLASFRTEHGSSFKCHVAGNDRVAEIHFLLTKEERKIFSSKINSFFEGEAVRKILADRGVGTYSFRLNDKLVRGFSTLLNSPELPTASKSIVSPKKVEPKQIVVVPKPKHEIIKIQKEPYTPTPPLKFPRKIK